MDMPKFNKDLPKLTALQFPRVSHVHLGKIWAQIWAWQRGIFFLKLTLLIWKRHLTCVRSGILSDISSEWHPSSGFMLASSSQTLDRHPDIPSAAHPPYTGICHPNLILTPSTQHFRTTWYRLSHMCQKPVAGVQGL